MGKIVISNVAGVNNITLPAENFSVAGTIPAKGFSIIHYKPLGKDINISDSNYTNLINIPGVDNDTKNISGITGTLNYYPEAKTLVFIFEANNQLYSIDVMLIEQNQVDEAEQAINTLLTAWLQASGYKQTHTLEKSNNEPNINNHKDSTEKSSWDPLTGKGTPSYDDYKHAGALKGDNDVSYSEYKDAMKDWDPNEEHVG